MLVTGPLLAQVVMERKMDGSVVITNHFRGSGSSRNATAGPAKVSAGVQVLQAAHRASSEIKAWVKTHAARANLEDRLVLSMIAVESDFDRNAHSAKGAMGLMQLMPGTAQDLGIVDPWDPESNIRGGTQYFRQLLDRFGQNLELALAAYNAGPGAVERSGGVPPYRETRDYVRRVLTRYRGRTAELSGTRLATASYRPIRVSRDQNGHLVILTP